MRGPEARVQDYAVAQFKAIGWLALKQDCGGGVTDFIFISPRAYMLFAEFKRPGRDKLDPQQEWFRDNLLSRIVAGCNNRTIGHILFNSREGVDEYIRRYNHYQIV